MSDSEYSVITSDVIKSFDCNTIYFFTYGHTGQCKSNGCCYNELVVANFCTGAGVEGKKIYTC